MRGSWLAFLSPPGSENVAVGTVIALLAEDGEDAAGVAAAKTPASAPPDLTIQTAPTNPRQHLLKIQPQARSQRRPPKHRWRSPQRCQRQPAVAAGFLPARLRGALRPTAGLIWRRLPAVVPMAHSAR